MVFVQVCLSLMSTWHSQWWRSTKLSFRSQSVCQMLLVESRHLKDTSSPYIAPSCSFGCKSCRNFHLHLQCSGPSPNLSPWTRVITRFHLFLQESCNWLSPIFSRCFLVRMPSWCRKPIDLSSVCRGLANSIQSLIALRRRRCRRRWRIVMSSLSLF